MLCGVVLMLLLTGTTLNIQSFMGAIMAVGISVANSILLVSLRSRRDRTEDVETAAHDRSRRQTACNSDDGHGHDLRHDSDGNWLWRRRCSVRALWDEP